MPHRTAVLDDASLLAAFEDSPMPSYILDGDREESSKSYVDFLRNPGAPREQGFLQSTRRICRGGERPTQVVL